MKVMISDSPSTSRCVRERVVIFGAAEAMRGRTTGHTGVLTRNIAMLSEVIGEWRRAASVHSRPGGTIRVAESIVREVISAVVLSIDDKEMPWCALPCFG
jgi:hypothetical protein